MANIGRVGNYGGEEFRWRIQNEIPDLYVSQVIIIQPGHSGLADHLWINIASEQLEVKVV
ncbi:MAG: hypothetical protein A2Y64_07580 [Candidatus Coatesbacteria bacterium RBG_13_66_14]|uniref:Uncharacterized protein n=1 Tax=Candidatus Coatesbacteria bacterium RBG_13_66_14 TaxID=1817816 RepID=A0A1F5EWB6_9BACT|nr:MAG: hypothetical protein A2Y64_07580 [Candidatus Coatesbacteria bacterium RBG_13_66_14]